MMNDSVLPETGVTDPAQANTERRVVLWGTYDLGKPRTRILRDGLDAVGIEVIEIHTDIWSAYEDKSQAGKAAVLLVLLRALLAYPGLVLRYLRTPAHEAVIVPYLGQFDVIVLKPFAWLRGRPVIWDMFISLYDTVVLDRQIVRPTHLVAYGLRALEWCACRAACLVVLDTDTHARRIAAMFGLAKGRTGAVPVGAEPGAFTRIAPRASHDGPTRILFYGQLIPLHGIATILEAALSERGRAHHWHLIGTGQDNAVAEAALADGASPHVTWERWRPYEQLIDAIEDADVCLGIFGASEKAASVIPNKVYQCLVAGRTVITRQSDAIEESFPAPHTGLFPIPHSDHAALLDAIEEAAQKGFPAMPEEQLVIARPEEIGRQLAALLTDISREVPARAQ